MSTEIMWKPRRNNAHEITQQKQTHRLRKPNLQLRGEDGGRKEVREFGVGVYSLLHLKRITSSVLRRSPGTWSGRAA